jgi:anti-anti-sigma regulatory factor/putative methionine-R-sulfoxide reductase with GAF domain
VSAKDGLYAELVRTRAEFLALLTVNQTLRVSRDLSALYRVVGSQLANVIQFDSFFVGIYLPETEQIDFEYGLDEGVVDDETVILSLDKTPLCARIVRERQPIRIDDLDRELRQTLTLTSFGRKEKHSRAWLGVPMICGDQIQGVLAVQSYQPAAFSDMDADLLMLLASQVAIAVENAHLFQRLKRTIAELSTPIIPVAEGVLVLPLIGTIDAERAERTTEQVLDAIVARQAETLLIDVTGVTAVDSFVVDQLLKITRAAGLLGTQSSIVGISAAMARSFIALDLDLRRLQTFSDLQSALTIILARGQESDS